MTRPATSLVNAFTSRLKSNKGKHRISISRRSLQQWLHWAKSIDARMRLDHSARNKHKKAVRKN